MSSVIRRTACGLAVASVLLVARPAVAQDFPDDAEYGYLDIARVAAESSEGQTANTRVQALSEEKIAEIEARNAEAQGEINALNQQLQEAQQKLQQGQNVISPAAANALQREISRLQVDIQRTRQDSQAEIARMTEDAEAEVQQLQMELQSAFEQRLLPAIDRLAAERDLTFIFNTQGLVWADPSLDLTDELIAALDSGAP